MGEVVKEMLRVGLLALLFAGCAPSVPSSKATVQPSATPHSSASLSIEEEETRFAATLLKDQEHCAPALVWLHDRRHLLWKGNRAAIIEHFEALQKLSVPAITACVYGPQDKQLCGAFVVTLPKRDRAAIFAAYNAFCKQHNPDSYSLVEDKGQPYLLYSFD